jgi:hypothetical protein
MSWLQTPGVIDLDNFEPHEIREKYTGVYETILHDTPDELVYELISDKFDWILCWEHWVEGEAETGWAEFFLPVAGNQRNRKVFTRGFYFDLLCKTNEYLDMNLGIANLRMVQFDNFPQRYLELSKIKGQQRFRLLDELRWNFLCEINSDKYFYLGSPNRKLVEHAIQWAENNES